RLAGEDLLLDEGEADAELREQQSHLVAVAGGQEIVEPHRRRRVLRRGAVLNRTSAVVETRRARRRPDVALSPDAAEAPRFAGRPAGDLRGAGFAHYTNDVAPDGAGRRARAGMRCSDRGRGRPRSAARSGTPPGPDGGSAPRRPRRRVRRQGG